MRAGADGPERQAALEAFCRNYWYPVYAFIRRRGAVPEDAEDLTQAFFERLIEKDWLAGVEREGARFSTLLLTMLKRFLINEAEHRQSQKRGGGRRFIPIELAEAERDFGTELTTHETPERLFERRWALAVLASAINVLFIEAEAAGKSRAFAVLSPFLSREPESHEYQEAAETLGMTRGAVAVAVHRLRGRYREVLREELAAGAPPDPGDADDSMRALWEALTGSSRA